ncbi:hypothetical protein [Actinomadura oligospora]|uniref:hypothetical protein n=1 Tax=Actinomadura oligospora TaxID=111804 RepID=UPI0004B76807|nr:hypothetical protein [Actinomadura oligospora]
MADLYELLLTAELPADLPDNELAELRWHLGTAPQPTEFTIVTDWPIDYVGDGDPGQDDSEDSWEIYPTPLLANRGPADARIGGVEFSELALREDRFPAWVLTTRQALHGPTHWDMLYDLIHWLDQRKTSPWGTSELAFYLRHCEDELLTAATLKDDRIVSRQDPTHTL